MRRTWLVTLTTIVLATRPSNAGELAAAIDELIAGPNYKHSRWGILAVETKTGRVLYEHNADQFFIPASTTKLYTCAAALKVLGPDHVFDTKLFARGDIKDGTLRGDLILRASGDPSFGSRTLADGTMAFVNDDHTYADSTSTTSSLTPTDPLRAMKELAAAVRAAGVKAVTGDVLIDDRLFDKSASSGSGPDLVTPVVVNDNVFDIIVTPASKEGDAASVVVRPETSFVRVDTQVRTAAKGTPTVSVSRAGPYEIVVRGNVPVGGKSQVRIAFVKNPTDFARKVLIEALRREGVTVEADLFAEPKNDLPAVAEYERLTAIASYRSPKLSELVKVVLKVSHNMYASMLPVLCATSRGKRTLADGLKIEAEVLKQLGVDTDGVSFAGGAGGSRVDATTPRATVQLLAALVAKPEYAALDAGLPVLGKDGTLAKVVSADSPARGHVRGKTGTLWYDDLLNGRALLTSKALAGTATTAAGTNVVFAAFVNNVPLPKGVKPSREGKALGRLAELLYLHGK